MSKCNRDRREQARNKKMAWENETKSTMKPTQEEIKSICECVSRLEPEFSRVLNNIKPNELNEKFSTAFTAGRHKIIFCGRKLSFHLLNRRNSGYFAHDAITLRSKTNRSIGFVFDLLAFAELFQKLPELYSTVPQVIFDHLTTTEVFDEKGIKSVVSIPNANLIVASASVLDYESFKPTCQHAICIQK